MLHVITQQTWSHGTDGWSRTQGYWVIANLESNCWTVLTQSVRVHELHHTLARVSLVRECCNGDDESLWRTGKFDPSIQRPLNWSSPKFAYAIHYVRDSYQNAKVHPEWITGFVSAHARLCACVGYFFQFFFGTSNRRAHRFLRKIRRKTWFRDRMCILGVAKPLPKILTLFLITANFGVQLLINDRETCYLFQRISVLIQRFNATLVHESFADENRSDDWPLEL